MKTNYSKPTRKILFYFLGTIIVIALTCCATRKSKNNYLGSAFTDHEYKTGIQNIPGKLQCEYFDIGGEGISFHDSDTVNKGSGGLNKGTDYLNNFRKKEAVDISYTKFHDSIDNSKYNVVATLPNELYIGWTEPGEWTKYTIDVKESGTYQIGLMYTSNKGGQISMAINDVDKTGLINVPSTFAESDPLAWRNWHHWNYIDSLAAIELKKGVQVLTLHTVLNGNMNYDFLSFTYKK